MLKEVSLKWATRIINSGALLMVGSKGEKRDNASPVAWNMPGSKTPPSVFLTVGPSHETWKNIERTGEFSCSVVSKEMIDYVAYFGAVSGSEYDKFKISGLKYQRGKILDVPVISMSPGVLECKVIFMDNDLHLIKGEIIYCEVEEEFFHETWKINSRFSPVHHLGGENFQVGEEIIKRERITSWNEVTNVIKKK